MVVGGGARKNRAKNGNPTGSLSPVLMEWAPGDNEMHGTGVQEKAVLGPGKPPPILLGMCT